MKNRWDNDKPEKHTSVKTRTCYGYLESGPHQARAPCAGVWGIHDPNQIVDIFEPEDPRNPVNVQGSFSIMEL